MATHLEYKIEELDICDHFRQIMPYVRRLFSQHAPRQVDIIGIDLGSMLHIKVLQDEHVESIKELLTHDIAGFKLTFRREHEPWPVSGIVIEAGHCSPDEVPNIRGRCERTKIERN